MTITQVAWATSYEEPRREENILIVTHTCSGSPSVPAATWTRQNTPKSRGDRGDAQPRARPSPALPPRCPSHPFSTERYSQGESSPHREPGEGGEARGGRRSPNTTLLRPSPGRGYLRPSPGRGYLSPPHPRPAPPHPPLKV